MSNFVFSLPTRVVFGSGTIDSVGAEAQSLGTSALLVTGSAFARRSGLIDRMRASLAGAGLEVTVYDQIERRPTIGAIDQGAAVAREHGVDLVVGAGGGSALDAAKAIALAVGSNQPLSDVLSAAGNAPPGVLPLVQVPIIASTGSETNDTTVVFGDDGGPPRLLSHPNLFARVAVVDPALTFTVPAHFTAVGAINIVSQMLETYLSGDEFTVSDRIAEGLVRVVLDSLARALRHGEDLDARTNLSWAATIAASATTAGRSRVVPLRLLAYPLTARFDMEHGAVLAGLWPSFMRYALSNRYRLPQIGRYKRYALLGRQCFGVHETDDEVAAETTLFRFTSWLRSMDMPTDLRSLPLEDVNLGALASQAVALAGGTSRLPSGLTARDIEHIYEGALRSA